MKKAKIIKTILVAIKLILFIIAIILSYQLSNRFIDWIITIDTNITKRILNIVLVIIIVNLGNYKKIK